MADEAAQFTAIWEEAFHIYKSETKRDILSDSQIRKLRTTSDLLDELESQERKFQGFLAKKNKLWSALKTSMDPVQVLGDVAQGALEGTPFAPPTVIFAAISYLIKSAKGVSEVYESITELLEQLADFSDRLGEYTKDVIDAKLRKRVTLILATMLEIIAKSERAITRGRLKEFARVAFLGKDGGVADAIARLRVLVDSEGRFVVAKTWSTAQKLDKDLGGISSAILESKKERLEDTERKTVENSLSSDAVDKVSQVQSRNSADHQKGSGEWVKNENLYISWLKEEEPLLWILGGPGAGKSFLASTIITHLLETHSQDARSFSRYSIGYFYIKEDDAQLRSLNIILKTLAYQLQTRNAVYAKYLVKSCNNREKTIDAVSTWKNLFLDFFGSPQYGDNVAFIVLDGVDEAPRKEREDLFKLLKNLTNPTSSFRPRIQVLLMGRPDLRDDTAFIWDKPVIYIEVSARKTKDDIVAYIKSSVGRVRALKQTREPLDSRLKLRKEIIQKLSDGANGMFLWVNLMLDQVYDISRPSDVTEALNNAPRSLSEMIRHVFERLADDMRGFRKDDFNEILTWVTCAQRPLKLAELDAVLKLRPPLGEGVPDLEDRLRGQFASFFILTRRDGLTTDTLLERASQLAKTATDTLNPDTESEFHDDPVSTLSSSSECWEIESQADSSDAELLDATQASDPYASDFSTTVIQFSHASIRDFLVQESNSQTRQYPADLGIGINTEEAEKHIAMTCLQVITEELTLPEEDEEVGSDNDSDTSHSSGYTENDPMYHFNAYAADNFIKHVRALSPQLPSSERITFSRSFLRLFHHKNALRNWIEGTTCNLSVFAADWLVTSKHAEFIRSWFKTELLDEGRYNTVEIQEMKEASESDQELCKSLAAECANRWLGIEDNYFIDEYLVFLDKYVPMDVLDTTIVNATPAIDDLDSISPTRIRRIAEFFNLKKTSIWHANLAEGLRALDHPREAVGEFFYAIELDKNNRLAMGGLSQCYEDLELYTLGIEWAQKALKVCPSDIDDDRSEYWQCISRCSVQLGDFSTAKYAAKEACRLTPYDGDALSAYIMALNGAMDHSTLIEYAEGLQSRSDSTGENLLTAALLSNDYLLEVLGYAAMALGKLSFVIEAEKTAIEAVTRDEDFQEIATQNRLLAYLYFTYTEDLKSAVYHWELARSSPDATERVILGSEANLAEIYYAEALRAERSGKSSRQLVTKLENLCKYDSKTGWTSLSKSSLILGLWFRDNGKELEARNCFRRLILEAIDMLTDSDPENDETGWECLAEALIKTGDMTNTAAAYAVVLQGIDKLKSKGNETFVDAGNCGVANLQHGVFQYTPRVPQIVNTEITLAEAPTAERPANKTYDRPFHWFCDGLCRRKPESWLGLYICKICLESSCFCEECIDILRAAKLPFRSCDPSHSFYQAYPVREGYGLTEGGLIKIDGKEYEVDVWLASLRKEWAVTK